MGDMGETLTGKLSGASGSIQGVLDNNHPAELKEALEGWYSRKGQRSKKGISLEILRKYYGFSSSFVIEPDDIPVAYI